jgi:hypothetical protein
MRVVRHDRERVCRNSGYGSRAASPTTVVIVRAVPWCGIVSAAAAPVLMADHLPGAGLVSRADQPWGVAGVIKLCVAFHDRKRFFGLQR